VTHAAAADTSSQSVWLAHPHSHLKHSMNKQRNEWINQSIYLSTDNRFIHPAIHPSINQIDRSINHSIFKLVKYCTLKQNSQRPFTKLISRLLVSSGCSIKIHLFGVLIYHFNRIWILKPQCSLIGINQTQPKLAHQFTGPIHLTAPI